MGVINHNAIIATTWDFLEIDRLLKWVEDRPDRDLIQKLLLTVKSPFGYHTAVLTPDGSKEGWKDSDAGDAMRDAFVEFIAEAAYEDGPNPWRWVEAGYGDFGQKLLRGNCRNELDDREYCEPEFSAKVKTAPTPPRRGSGPVSDTGSSGPSTNPWTRALRQKGL